jgi:hypothetical protein
MEEHRAWEGVIRGDRMHKRRGIKENTVRDVIDILQNRSRVNEMVEYNYSLAKRFYSYANLRRELRFILADFFGEE